MDFLYLLCTPRTCIVLKVLLYCSNLRFDDDGIEPPVMEDVVPAPVTMSIVAHNPFVVVSELPLVVLESIFDFVKETMGEHDDIAQSLESMGSVRKLRNPLTIAFRLFSLHTLHTIPFFFGNALYVCLNEPFTYKLVVMSFVFLAFSN